MVTAGASAVVLTKADGSKVRLNTLEQMIALLLKTNVVASPVPQQINLKKKEVVLNKGVFLPFVFGLCYMMFSDFPEQPRRLEMCLVLTKAEFFYGFSFEKNYLSLKTNVGANDCVALLSHTSHPQKLEKIEAAFPGIVK